MRIPVHVTFRGMDPSPSIEQMLRDKIESLGAIESRATGAHVVVEPTDHRHRHGTIHRYTIRLEVPGDDIVVSRESGLDGAHADPYVALRDACDALKRQVIDRHHARVSQRR